MVTVAILLMLGVAFAVFAVLGPAERGRACDHARVGDPKCEHCALGDEGEMMAGGASGRGTGEGAAR